MNVRKILGTLTVVLLVFFVISQPGRAAMSVRSIGTSLAGAGAVRDRLRRRSSWCSPVLAPREIDEYLLPTERRVIRVRQHWAVMAKDLILTGLFLLLMVVAAELPPVERRGRQPDVLPRAGRRAAVHRERCLWWIERIVITDKRVMLAQGIITHKVGMMPLSKVTDLTFERTPGRPHARLRHDRSSSRRARSRRCNRINYVPRPEEIYEALSS